MIKQFIEKFLCKHQWEVHGKIYLWDESITDKRPIGIEEILFCKLCGKIKKISL